MTIPSEFDVSQDGMGATEWIPLNRYGSALHRLWVSDPGSATFSIEGTSSNVVRGETPTAETITSVEGFSGVSTDKTSTQNLMFRAIRLNVTAGTGVVRMQGLSEG